MNQEQLDQLHTTKVRPEEKKRAWKKEQTKGLSSSILDDIKTKMDKAQGNKNDDDDNEEDDKPTVQEKKQAEEAQDADDLDDSDDDGPMKKVQKKESFCPG